MQCTPVACDGTEYPSVVARAISGDDFLRERIDAGPRLRVFLAVTLDVEPKPMRGIPLKPASGGSVQDARTSVKAAATATVRELLSVLNTMVAEGSYFREGKPA